MHLFKKSLSILLAVTIALGAFTAMPVFAAATTAVSYIERAWESETNAVISTEKSCSNYIDLSALSDTALQAGWYVVSKNCTIAERLMVNAGDVHLIVCDGVTVTLNKGIGVLPAGNLFIYGQANDSGKIFAQTITAPDDSEHDCAIIGGVQNQDCGNVTVYGGTIDLTLRGGEGACIGGSNGRGAGIIRIYGGNITCHNEAGQGAAIGGGYEATMSRIEGESVRIYGGTIDVKSWGGASIGSGLRGNCNQDGIGIYGGRITAQCSTGAGIGGGERGKNGPIHIYGGEINTVAYDGGNTGAGIGSGVHESQGGAIDISGGIVVATSRNGAGIGGGLEGSASVINITGGKVVAQSAQGGAGIGGGAEGGDGGTISILNSIVVATSSNYGSMDEAADDILLCMNHMDPNPSEMSQGVISFFLGILSLIVDAFGAEESGSGIGGGSESGAVTAITIQNSSVTAKCGNYAAAIGSGEESDIGSITIDNSNVTAESGDYGAAIGSGDEAENTGTIRIINGSVVNAKAGSDAAAIGTGNECDNACEAIYIKDSNVTADGGEYAASIGGGDNVGGGNITIDHSVVNVDRNPYYYEEQPGDEQSTRLHTNCDGAGIGGGEDGDGGTITITNHSTVTAKGGDYAAGIGGGDAGNGGTILIENSAVKAYGGMDGAGIGGGEGGEGGTIKMINANVYAEGKSYGAGVGNGEDGDNADIEIYGNNSNIEAIAGGDGKSAAIGHGGNGIFYEDHIKLYLAPELKAEVGSDKDHTTVYYGDSRYQPLFSAKYAKIYACRHENTEWRSDGVEMHVQYCLTCGMRLGSTAISHEWNSENICTVCGASAEIGSITFTQTDSSGATVQTTVEGPKRAKVKTPACTHAPNGTEFVCWSDGYNYYGANYDIGVPSSGSTTLHAVYLPLKEVSYINQSGEADTVMARQLTSTDLILTGGWYVVENNLQAINTLKIDGDIHLILADGATFSFYQGFDYYDLEHIDCFATFQNCTSSLRVYGQAEQSGTLMIGNRHSLFDDFVQYGGVVDSSRGFFEAAKNCTIAGGTFKAMVLACDRAAVLGGNATIGNLPLNKSLQLGWQQKSDRIHFDALESENTSVVANQAFCDENGNVYKGSLSAAQVNAMAGKTLMPYLEHDYAQPEWVWSDEYTNAEAIFRCKDCTQEQTVNAKVTWEDEGNSRTSHAVCNFNGETYTDTRTANIMWNITVAETEHGTISADKAHAKAGEFVELTLTPDEGYVLDTMQVSDSEGTPIEVENDTFKMPASDVSITGSFKITTHTVRWVVGGETVETDENVPYGETPEFNGETPASYYDGEVEFVFAGWSPALAPVTEDAVYTAVYHASGKIRVPYIDETGTQRFAVATILTGSETSLESGWYVVRSQMHYQDEVKISEGVNLILADGAALYVKNFDYADYNKICTLNVFAQSEQTGSLETESGNSLMGLNIYGGNVNLPLALAADAGFYSGNIQIGNLFVPPEIGTITLGCREYDDRIQIGTLSNSAVRIAQGQTLYDGKALYSDTLTAAQVTALEGKTLRKATHHTVRWVVGGETVETDENVLITSTPSFDGTLPATYIKDHTRYSFSGWSDSQKLYTDETLPAVTKDVTYTAVYTAVQKADNGVSLTVGRDITSNYYVDYLFYDGAATVRYTYNAVNELEQNVPVTKTVNLENIPAEMTATAGAEKRLMLTVSQAPAQMAETTKIEILNANGDVIDTLYYSAKTYCDNVIAMSEEEIAAYTDKGAALKTLCETLIAYGYAAQGVFADYETTPIASTAFSDTVKTQIDEACCAPQYSVNNAGQIRFKSISFACTKDARLRFFLDTSGATSTPAAPTAENGRQAKLKYVMVGFEKRYFIEVNDIDATDFDEQIIVNYGGSRLACSVLDFCGIVLSNNTASAAMVNLAKTLIAYHQNAHAFFE